LLKKRADGRYSKQIMLGYKPDGTRNVKTVYGKTIRELEKKHRELMAKIDSGFDILQENLTVAKWAMKWLETYKRNVEKNTYNCYKCAIENHIIPKFGYLKLQKLNLNDIQEYINSIAGQYSDSTLSKIKITLNQMYKTAINLKIVNNNPVAGLIMPKKINTEKAPIPDEHIEYLKEFCPDFKHGAVIMTLLYTGIRKGELVALNKSDIDLENGLIAITKSAEFTNNKPTIKSPKSRSSYRTVPIPDILKPYLNNIKSKNDSEPLFKNSEGERHTAVSIRRLYENFLKEYNRFLKEKLKDDYTEVKFTMHQFRHSYSTILYKSNVDAKVAQKILGHSSYSVTFDVYTHLDKQYPNIAANKLNEFICK